MRSYTTLIIALYCLGSTYCFGTPEIDFDGGPEHCCFLLRTGFRSILQHPGKHRRLEVLLGHLVFDKFRWQLCKLPGAPPELCCFPCELGTRKPSRKILHSLVSLGIVSQRSVTPTCRDMVHSPVHIREYLPKLRHCFLCEFVEGILPVRRHVVPICKIKHESDHISIVSLAG